MRRWLALVAFVAIVALSIDPMLFRFAFFRRPQMQRALAVFPDRGIWWPDYPRFLDAVRERTHRGDSIAIVVPAMRWEEGYDYAYYRASYFLAGREVLPIVTPLNRFLPDNLARAQYIAVWGRTPQIGRPVVWRGYRGVLLGR